MSCFVSLCGHSRHSNVLYSVTASLVPYHKHTLRDAIDGGGGKGIMGETLKNQNKTENGRMVCGSRRKKKFEYVSCEFRRLQD